MPSATHTFIFQREIKRGKEDLIMLLLLLFHVLSLGCVYNSPFVHLKNEEDSVLPLVSSGEGRFVPLAAIPHTVPIFYLNNHLLRCRSCNLHHITCMSTHITNVSPPCWLHPSGFSFLAIHQLHLQLPEPLHVRKEKSVGFLFLFALKELPSTF